MSLLLLVSHVTQLREQLDRLRVPTREHGTARGGLFHFHVVPPLLIRVPVVIPVLSEPGLEVPRGLRVLLAGKQLLVLAHVPRLGLEGVVLAIVDRRIERHRRDRMLLVDHQVCEHALVLVTADEAPRAVATVGLKAHLRAPLSKLGGEALERREASVAVTAAPALLGVEAARDRRHEGLVVLPLGTHSDQPSVDRRVCACAVDHLWRVRCHQHAEHVNGLLLVEDEVRVNEHDRLVFSLPEGRQLEHVDRFDAVLGQTHLLGVVAHGLRVGRSVAQYDAVLPVHFALLIGHAGEVSQQDHLHLRFLVAHLVLGQCGAGLEQREHRLAVVVRHPRGRVFLGKVHPHRGNGQLLALRQLAALFVVHLDRRRGRRRSRKGGLGLVRAGGDLHSRSWHAAVLGSERLEASVCQSHEGDLARVAREHCMGGRGIEAVDRQRGAGLLLGLRPHVLTLESVRIPFDRQLGHLRKGASRRTKVRLAAEEAHAQIHERLLVELIKLRVHELRPHLSDGLVLPRALETEERLHLRIGRVAERLDPARHLLLSMLVAAQIQGVVGTRLDELFEVRNAMEHRVAHNAEQHNRTLCNTERLQLL